MDIWVSLARDLVLFILFIFGLLFLVLNIKPLFRKLLKFHLIIIQDDLEGSKSYLEKHKGSKDRCLDVQEEIVDIQVHIKKVREMVKGDV